MSTDTRDRPFLRFILLWAGIVVIVAGMRASASLVVPFLLSLFLAILCGPPLGWLMKRGLRRSFAMLIVLGGLCFVVLMLANIVVDNANQFLTDWPTKYQPRVEAIPGNLETWWKDKVKDSHWLQLLRPKEADAGSPPTDDPPSDDPPSTDEETTEEDAAVEPSTPTDEPAAPVPVADDPLRGLGGPLAPVHHASTAPASSRTQWNEWIKPDFLMQVFTTGMRAVSGILSQVLLILVTTIFLLMEASTLPTKMQAIAGAGPSRIAELRRIAEEINRYMAIKTSTSLLTGVVVTVALWLLNVDFALLWGMTAFLLNYVPNIGSIIAAIPAVLLAFVLHGLGTAAIVIGLYVAVNMIVGYFLEPRWMGKGLGLSTLVVFVSLVFWGWVLGPVGMVISVPLTMTVKIILEGNDETRWLAILMGPGIEPSQG